MNIHLFAVRSKKSNAHFDVYSRYIESVRKKPYIWGIKGGAKNSQSISVAASGDVVLIINFPEDKIEIAKIKSINTDGEKVSIQRWGDPAWKNIVEFSGPPFATKMKVQEFKSLIGRLFGYDERGAFDRISFSLVAKKHEPTFGELWDALSFNPKYTSKNSIAREMEEILRNPKTTIRESLIEARVGQGKFRQDVIAKWGGKCALTGCRQLDILRASHVKPWHSSSNKERLDPSNGILLIATLDAAFDAGLFTIQDDGLVVISSKISSGNRKFLPLPRQIPAPFSARQKSYLKHHRENVFRK